MELAEYGGSDNAEPRILLRLIRATMLIINPLHQGC